MTECICISEMFPALWLILYWYDESVNAHRWVLEEAICGIPLCSPKRNECGR